MLSVLASEEFPSETDDDGYCFIDRDPEWFAQILQHLRGCPVCVPEPSDQRRALMREAQYYGLQQFHAALRLQPGIAVLTGVVWGGVMRHHLLIYNREAGTWRSFPFHVPHARQDFGCGCDPARRCIYVGGGRAGDGCALPSLVDRYSLSAGVWEGAEELPVAEVPQGTACSLFCTGERRVLWWRGGARLGLTARAGGMWDWVELPGDLKVRLVLGAQCRLVVFTTTGAVLCYEFAAGAWSAPSPVPSAKQNFAAVVWNGKVVVSGGCAPGLAGPTDTVDVFDPAPGARTWTAYPPLLQGRQLHLAVLLGGSVVVLCGIAQGNQLVRTMEIYDESRRCWRPLGTMPATGFWACSALCQPVMA